VNYLSAVWTTLAAIPPMLTRGGGTIVNVSSIAAVVAQAPARDRRRCDLRSHREAAS
jgi:NAD(P)-dependent dehydrogenase (short-subunit alcohol dehydrogenase family)